MERKPRFLGGNGDFSRIALRLYHDISHLLELRKDGIGNTRQGCREKCLFWAMNFAIHAGEVIPLNFDAYAQSLIDFCVNNTLLCGQVSPYIMMRARWTEYRYRVNQKKERGP